MERQKRKEAGITLIALVISIIVMLILAGVSINATVGDNGILKQTQNANIMQSIAVLQECFDLKRASQKNAESFEDKLISEYTFDYNPENGFLIKIPYNNGDTYIFDLQYIDRLDSKIKESLVGGEGENNSYYYLRNVYGINSNFKVYYIDNDGNIFGESSIEAIPINPNEEIEIAENYKQSIGITGNATLGDVRGKSNLIIDGTLNKTGINIDNLDELLLTPNITKLTLKNLNLKNISGLKYVTKLSEIWFDNTVVEDYSGMQYALNLKGYYAINGSLNESSILSFMDQTKNLPKLETIVVRNNPSLSKIPNLTTLGNATTLKIEENANLTNIIGLSTVSDKSKLQKLYLNENNLTDVITTDERNTTYNYLKPIINSNNIINMSYISDYVNLKELYLGPIGGNLGNVHEDLTIDKSLRNNSKIFYLAGIDNNNLKGINNLANLQYLDMKNCNIYDIESLSVFQENYSKNKNNLKYLDLIGNTNFQNAQANSVINFLVGINAKLDGKYASLLASNKETLDLSNSNLTDISFLENNKVTKNLNLLNNNLNDSQVKYLGSMTNLEFLTIKGNTKITDWSFLKNLVNLKKLNAENCTISDEDIENYLVNKANMTEIWLCNCKNIDSIAWLEKFPKLVGQIDMTNWKISDNEDLSILNNKNFTCIRTNKGNLTTFQVAISKANSNLGLHLRNTITMLAKLENCNQITNLTMSSNGLNTHDNYFDGENTLNLNKCTSLSSIYFMRNMIEHVKVTGCINLSSFTSINMNETTEWEIPDFSKNFKLKEINLDRNFISQGAFENFIDQITPIESDNIIVSGCSNLTKLILSNNNINSVKKLNNLAGKTNDSLTIDLQNNSIISLDGLEDLIQLREINLANNTGLTNINQLILLKSKNESKLEKVNLEGCTSLNSKQIDDLKNVGVEVIRQLKK